MKTYTLALAAGVPMLLPFGGRLFYFMEAAHPIDVEFFDANGQNAGEKLEAIPSGTWAEPDQGFSSMRIASAIAQSVKFIIATGRAGISRLTGDVSILDGGKARTLGNLAFMGIVQQPAVAAQFSHVQLFNPAGSGVRAMIQQIIAQTTLAGSIGGYRFDTPLTNLLAGAPSKNLGGAASVCELRNEANAVLQISGSGFFTVGVQALVSSPPVLFHEPIILLPGRGFVVFESPVNATINITYEFLEEPNL